MGKKCIFCIAKDNHWGNSKVPCNWSSVLSSITWPGHLVSWLLDKNYYVTTWMALNINVQRDNKYIGNRINRWFWQVFFHFNWILMYFECIAMIIKELACSCHVMHIQLSGFSLIAPTIIHNRQSINCNLIILISFMSKYLYTQTQHINTANWIQI